MKKYSMKKVIEKDSINLLVKKKSIGSIINGKYTGDTEQNLILFGSPFNMTMQEIKQYEAGRYTKQDIQIDVSEDYLFLKDLEGIETEYKINENDFIIWNDIKYKIMDIENETTHSDYFVFSGKKVSEDES